MQAITVRVLPCTNTRPTRYKAECSSGAIVLSESVSAENQQIRAFRALCAKFGWNKPANHAEQWAIGETKDGATVFVCVDPSREWEQVNVNENPAVPLTFTRIGLDTSGNPRYVCHFLNLNTQAELDDTALDSSAKYALAVKRANSIGGRKYHCKRYGGGIVFQSYSLKETIDSINRATGRNFREDC